MLCMNCGEEFIPSKNDSRIKFCSEFCRCENRRKNSYMKSYYSGNVDKWKERQSAEVYKMGKNEAKRARYANDEKYREDCKKKVSEYYKRNQDVRLSQRLRKYGISVSRYKELLAKQNNKCAICGSGIGDSTGNRLYVDHNHSDGCVRGLLCSKCNFGIGQFNDDIELLKKAIEYLEG